MYRPWTHWQDWALAVVLGSGLLLIPGYSYAAQAYLLDKAAESTEQNANFVALDDAFMWSAHNSFNPHEWANLSEVLESGVRGLELDFYSEGKISLPHFAVPITYRIRGVRTHDPSLIFEDILTHVLAGQDISDFDYQGLDQDTDPEHPQWLPLIIGNRFTVKHDPADEDWITRLGGDLLDDWLDAIGLDGVFPNSLEYGNNCGHGPIPAILSGLGGSLGGSLVPCLFEVKRWSDAHQGTSPGTAHLPIIVRLNIKTDFDGLTVPFFDAVVRGALGDRLITPDQVKDLGVAPGTYATLRERVEAIGWPTMGALRGKVLVLTYLGPVFASNPNEAHGDYVRTLLRRGFAPALFLCPEADNMADVVLGAVEVGRTTDSDAIRQAAAGYTACYTLQNHHTSEWKRGAYVRHPGAVVTLLNEIERRNFLSEVWSYDEIGYTTNYGGLLHRYIKHGVTFLERERLGLDGSYFPKVGLDSITDYAFSIRQIDNPAFALTANGNGVTVPPPPVSLEPYIGSASQHWVLREDNKLELVQAVPGSPNLVQGTGQCLWRLDVNADEDGHASPNFPEQLGVQPCNTTYAGGVVSLETLGAGAGRISAGLHRYVTPNGYAQGVKIYSKPWTNEAFVAGQSGSTGGTLGPLHHWGAMCGITINHPCPPARIRKQALGLFLDFYHIKRLGHAVNVPPFYAFGTPITYDGYQEMVLAQTWSETPLDPGLEPMVFQAMATGQLPAESYGIWQMGTITAMGGSWGYGTSGYSEAQLLNREVPWTALNPTNLPIGDGRTYGALTMEMIASQWMDAENFEKWQSGVAVDPADLPTGPGMELYADLFLDRTGDGSREGTDSERAIWQRRQDADRAVGAWRRPPITYDWLPNDRRKWALAEELLNAEQYVNWQQRVTTTVHDFYATDAIAAVAAQFLESTADDNEWAEWQARVAECRNLRGPAPWYCHVPAHYPQWYHLKFDRRLTLLAERLLTRDSQAWHAWHWVVGLLEALGGTPTWKDLPLESREVDLPAVAAALLSTHDREIWQVAYRFRAVTRATIADIPLALYFHELATQKLSAEDVETWMQRAMTTPADIPVNPALNAVAQAFLTAGEYAQWREALQNRVADVYDPLPSRWQDLPPATGNHELALALFTDARVLDDWERVHRLTAETFPYRFVSDQSRAIANLALAHRLPFDGTTEQSVYQQWDDLSREAQTVSSFEWDMLPCHADNRPIAEALLSPDELLLFEANCR